MMQGVIMKLFRFTYSSCLFHYKGWHYWLGCKFQQCFGCICFKWLQHSSCKSFFYSTKYIELLSTLNFNMLLYVAVAPARWAAYFCSEGTYGSCYCYCIQSQAWFCLPAFIVSLIPSLTKPNFCIFLSYQSFHLSNQFKHRAVYVL